MDASSDPPSECCPWCKSTTFTIDKHGSFRCPNCDGPGTFSELWLDVKSGGSLSKALAGDHTLAALRNLVRVRLSMDFDGHALDVLVDWLVDHHGMTYEEVFVSKLTRIVEILRSENAPKSAPTMVEEVATEFSYKGSKARLAEAVVLMYFMAHPDSNPTAEEIGSPHGIDAATIRNTPSWKAAQRGRGRGTEQAGDLGGHRP
jgi:hypothetical protein